MLQMCIRDSQYAEKYPDITASFLGVFLRAVDAFKKTPAEDLVAEYQRFYKTFVGKDYDTALALKDLQYHPVFSLEEQLELFDDTGAPSQIQRWQSSVAAFFREMCIRDSQYIVQSPLALQPHAQDQ